MIPLFNDRMVIGVGFMDIDHRHLCDVLDELMAGIKDGRELEQMHKTISELILYTEQHFEREKAAMQETEYPDRVAHLAGHDGFTRKVAEFQTRARVDDGRLVLDIVSFISTWLVAHIMSTDRKLGEYLRQCGRD